MIVDYNAPLDEAKKVFVPILELYGIPYVEQGYPEPQSVTEAKGAEAAVVKLEDVGKPISKDHTRGFWARVTESRLEGSNTHRRTFGRSGKRVYVDEGSIFLDLFGPKNGAKRVGKFVSAELVRAINRSKPGNRVHFTPAANLSDLRRDNDDVDLFFPIEIPFWRDSNDG